MFSYWFKSPLLIAAEDNDLAKVQQLLATATAETVNVSYGTKQTTALKAACEGGYTEITIALLAHPGIDVNGKRKVSSPLTQAATNGHTGIVKLLLARPEIDISEPYALYFAAERGHIEIVQALLACPNINVNFAGADELTSLNVAARENRYEVVKVLLACPDIDLKLVDYWGHAPLHNAAIMAHSDIVQLLLTHPDAEINAEDHLIGGTPLNGLLITNYDMPRGPCPPVAILKTAKLLLGHPGVKVDLIYGAQEEGNSEDIVAEADEEAGVTATITSDTAALVLLHNQLLAAVIGGDIEVVESLLAQQGVNVNVLGMMDRIPLHWAAFFGHTEMVRLLLAQSGIDLNAFDSDGRTPLALAAKHGHAETVKVLLEAPGVVVNSVTLGAVHSVLLQADQDFDESDTPVTDLVATLQVLLAHPSVDLSVLVDKSNPPDSVLPHARFLAAVLSGDTEKVNAFLVRTDIDVNVLSMDNHTALSWASYLGHVAIVQALVAHPKIDLQPSNVSGPLRAALGYAVRYDHIEIVKILLACLDAAVEQAAGYTIFYDCTLLSEAAALGRVEIVQLLVTRPDVNLALSKPHYTGRPTPERKLCEEMVRKAHAERLAQKAAVEAAQGNNKRRSWWDAFGLV